MTALDRLELVVDAALNAARDPGASAAERAEMLMEIATDLQQRPKTPAHLREAIALYDEALAICPPGEALLAARLHARKGSALAAAPQGGADELEQARAAFERAVRELESSGGAVELAEAEMNLGLVLQQLAGCGRAPITEAVAAYQRALRTFEPQYHPVEFAILQNNLATAFLAMPISDERAQMREAIAVRCFEAGLAAVSLHEHPEEYAMLQNNLGNALQYLPSSHKIENNLRAIAAYDEALEVRKRSGAPLAYANTLANRANCLRNLPDGAVPETAGGGRLACAKASFEEARDIFVEHGETEQARIVGDALAELERELAAGAG